MPAYAYTMRVVPIDAHRTEVLDLPPALCLLSKAMIDAI